MDALLKEKVMFKKKKGDDKKEEVKKGSKKPDHTKPSQGFMKKFGLMK